MNVRQGRIRPQAPRTASSAPRVGRWRRFWARKQHREALTGWLLVGPIMLYWIIFQFIPLAAVFVLSFVRWSGFFGTPEWVGFRNYLTLWRFPLYRDAVGHTILIAALILVVTVGVALAIALLLNTAVRGRGVYRAIWYLPTVVSFAIISQMFLSFLDPVSGVFDVVVHWLHQPPIIWQLNTAWMIFWIVVIATWHGIGTSMIIFLAGLQGIDRTLYEAGRMDGAGRAALFRHITLPSLRPITVFVAITAGLGALQIFEPVYLVSQGGPFGSTTVIIYRIYEDAFQDNQFGLASAMSVVFFLMSLAFTAFNWRLFGRRAD